MPSRVATPLPPLNSQPDRIEMAEERRRRGEDCRARATAMRAISTAAAPLAHVEQQGRRRQPLAPGAQHVGRADIARADLRAGRPRRTAASGSARTGSSRADSRAASRAAGAAHRYSVGKASPPVVADIEQARAPPPLILITTRRAGPDGGPHGRRGRSCSSIPASAGCRCSPRCARCCRRPMVYVADSAGFPYGTKSEAEIAARVPALLGRLAERYRSAADRDRLQHRLDHRARRGPRRARPADRRHRARDQARRRAEPRRA